MTARTFPAPRHPLRRLIALAFLSAALALLSCNQPEAEFAEILRGSEAELVALHVNSKLAKNTYACGEALDISYLFVQGEYSDGTKRKLAISVEENITGYHALEPGEQTLTIFVGTVSAEWKVKVTDKAPAGLEILSPPEKTVYAHGEAFEAAGLTVKGIYTDGSCDEFALDENAVTGFSSETEGTVECNAVWQGQRAMFTVTIVPAQLVSVRTDTPPDKVRYVLSADGGTVQTADGLSAAGDAISVTGGAFTPLTDGITFTGTYTDGTEKPLSVLDAAALPQIQARSGVAGVSFLFGEYRGAEIRAGFTAYIYEADFHIDATRTQGSFSGADILYDADGNITVDGKASYSANHNGKGAFGTDGVQTQIAPFLISAEEESYTQWVTVRAWAVENGYTFSDRAGIEGSDGDMFSTDKSPESDKGTGQPVCYINFRDAVVYCNAKSRMAGLEPVYFASTGSATGSTGSLTASADSLTELKDAEDGECDNPVVCTENSGYRLPTAEEWEFAARGGIASLYAQNAPKETALPGDFNRSIWSAPWSGAETSTELAAYCVYEQSGFLSTEKCASLCYNALGIYDMSGNTAEWTETFSASNTTNDESRLVMGGNCMDTAVMMQVSCRLTSQYPDIRSPNIGFRTVRSAR